MVAEDIIEMVFNFLHGFGISSPMDPKTSWKKIALVGFVVCLFVLLIIYLIMRFT